MRNLWLDDLRPAPDSSWAIASTADEAIALLSENQYDLVSLDHDLDDAAHYFGLNDTNEMIVPEERPAVKTGLDVCLWLRQKVETDPSFRMPVVRLHTSNSVGRANMAAVLGEIADLLTERALEKG